MSFKKSPKKTSEPLTKEEELLEELKSLRVENDYLKKLYALIQKEVPQKSKRQ